MKIVYLQDDFEPYALGGSAPVVLAMAKRLASEGHEVYVVTTVRELGQAGSFVEGGLKIERVHIPYYHERWKAYKSLYNPQAVEAVKAILTKIKPDIVHAHNIHQYLSYHCLKIAHQSGAKVFLTAHDVMLVSHGKLMGGDVGYKVSALEQLVKYKWRYNPVRNLIIGCYLKYVDKIFAVSLALKSVLNQNGIENVEVIYNALDVNAWRVSDEQVDKFKAEYNLTKKKVILFGGRLDSVKGGHQAIAALAKVVKEEPGAILLVMGERNAYTETMLKVAKERGLNQKIIFTGWLTHDKLKTAYYVSDVVIAPSICFDTFGMVCLEAMTSGKPVIGSQFGGMKEVIKDGETGYIVDPYDIESLAQKIYLLLSDLSKAEAFGSAGKKRAQELFPLNHEISRLLGFYKK